MTLAISQLIILADSFSRAQVGRAWGKRLHLAVQKQPLWYLSAGEIGAQLWEAFHLVLSIGVTPGPHSADTKPNAQI